ncbi:MAG: PAS domain S-box protein [Armatimonadetes bacterium]|nr:PAS domain S-box protein [Armatimonadota bacterium]
MVQRDESFEGLAVEHILDELPQATIVFDSQGIIRYWNREAERVFVWSADEAVGKHWTMLVPIEKRIDFGYVWQALMSGGIRHSINENLTKDGRTILCFWNNAPLRVGERVVGVVSVATLLSRSEKLVGFIIDNALDGIAIVNPQGFFMLANRKLCQMLGCDADELIGVSLLKFVHPEDEQRVSECCKKLYNGEVECLSERVRLISKDGRALTCLVEATPFRDIAGNVLGYLLEVHDITDQAVAEAEAMRLFNKLVVRSQLLSVAFEATMQPLDTCAERILTGVIELIDAHGGFVFVIDDGKPKLIAWRNISDELLKILRSLRRLPSWMQRPLTLHEDANWRIGLLNALRRDGFRSFLSAPLIMDDECVSVIAVASKSRAALLGEDIEALLEASRILAIAIHHSQLEGRIKDSIRKLQTLREIGQVVLEQFDIEASVNAVLKAVIEGLNADAAAVTLYDEEQKRCRLFVMTFSDGERISEQAFEVDSTLCECFIERHETIFIRDIDSDGRVRLIPSALHGRQLKAYAGSPLIVRGKAIGALHMFMSKPKEFTNDEIEFMQALAHQVAIAYESARMFNEAIEQVQMLQRFLGAQSSIATVEPEAIALEVLKWLKKTLGIERADFYSYDELEGSLHLESSIGFREGRLEEAKLEEHAVIKLGEGVIGKVALEKRAIYVPDCEGDLQWRSFAADSDRPMRSAYIVPLTFGERLFGVIVVAEDEPNAISAFKRHLIDLFAVYISAGLEVARLLSNLKRAYNELRQTQAALTQQERLRALGQMASGIAHDINNALVPIVGYSELLLELATGEVRQYAELIHRAATDIVHIVERLRAFYRPRMPNEQFEPVSLSRSAMQAVDLTKPRWYDMAQREGVTIEIKFEFDESLPPIAAVGAEVREALVNLILNAADAIIAKRSDRGVITLRTGSKDGWAFVEVEDDGTGMDEETRQRAIEPFYSTKGERGTGLGLPIVYGIMQRHEGLLEIESKPGVGTKVRLLFPMRTIDHPMNSEELSKETPRLKILLIDDDLRVLSTISDMLKGLGHKVDVADSGEAGLRKFFEALTYGSPYELVITDLGMPEVSGIEVVRRVKEASPKTPVLVLTGWGREAIPREADGIVSKPIKLSELRSAISNIAEQRKSSSH